MKNIKLLYYITILLSASLQSMDTQIFLTTIFTPFPLLELHYKKIKENSYIEYAKNFAVPLTGCFFYTIKKNDVWADLAQNPITAAICIYVITHYCLQLARQHQQNHIHEEIIQTMQNLFHLLIIGHGIYNKITRPSFHQYKASAAINPSDLISLQFFLNNAYNSWSILFSYYQDHYKNKPLYTYRMDQIDVFEVLQASMHQPDISPFIEIFYNKNNTMYNYEPIFNCLDNKLKQVNLKMQTILSL